ncbi:hypothetical protein ABZ934_27275 [Streptomyces sp. NPDC046557]|uniref:hypothetical protein n=1 Tax=Streptomyces sp. NPDC046557 TaxID=3155372 RepID=UPI0033D29173
MRMRGGVEYMVPALYVMPVEPAGLVSKGGFRLFEDEDSRQLLCTVLPDGSDRYRVRNAVGQELGSVRRTPVTKRLTQHGLGMEQSGPPAIVAPRNWARGGPGARGGPCPRRGRGLPAVLRVRRRHRLRLTPQTRGLGGGREDGQEEGADGRYGEAVLTFPRTTDDKRWYFVKRDGRLDKRLAFALAVLRESEAFGADHR